MKKLSITAMLFLATTFAFGQKVDASKVPAAVKTNFMKAYPHAQSAMWEMEDKNYEANFKHDGHSMSAVYTPSGELVETEEMIAANALPAAATDYIHKNHKNATIKEVSKIKKANGEINYEAEVEGMEMIFDAKGNYLKSKKEKY